MFDSSLLLMLLIFTLTILFIVWKPLGINETIPTVIGASLVLLFGIVPIDGVKNIFHIISGASITIISTIVMTIVLESIGFFQWVAFNIVNKSKGSGIRLFIYVNILCYLTTLFFNNDGSILITTPILINVVNILKLKHNQKIPYLLSGALIATASSAPIAVSNIANLIALKIVGLDLNSYVKLMFIPSMIGISVLSILIYIYFRVDIPKKIRSFHLEGIQSQYVFFSRHPLDHRPHPESQIDWWMFNVSMFIVVLVRGSFFMLAPYGVPIEWIAIVGAIILIVIRWYRQKTGIRDVMMKTPWHIFIFAFSMYILVYGLRNVGLNSWLVENLSGYISNSNFNAIFIMGTLLTVLSNLCNNLPAVMIGTLTLTEMDLSIEILQVAYLANVLGSDIGALISPMGTLATLIWMFLLRKNGIPLTWGQYFKVTIMVIPIGLLVSLISLYIWTELIL
jgi:arsenical pump membrane protein